MEDDLDVDAADEACFLEELEDCDGVIAVALK